MKRSPQRSVRVWMRWAWIYFLYWCGLTFWARTKLERSGGVIVLTLHRVVEDAGVDITRSPMGMIVRKGTFQELLSYLKKNCEVVRLEEAFAPVERTAKPRFVITFDDGWKDTASVAHPLAEEFGMPIALFVCPGLVNKQSPFWAERVIRVWRAASIDLDRRRSFATVCRKAGLEELIPSTVSLRSEEEAVLSRLKHLSSRDLVTFVGNVDALAAKWGKDETADPLEGTLSWEELNKLHEKGVSIGSHTQNHSILTQIPQSEIAGELAESKKEIERVFNQQCTLFAYPNGSWSPFAREEVRKQGYTLAFANQPGLWTPRTDSWLIPRVNIWEGAITGLSGDFSPAVFEYATYWRVAWTKLTNAPTSSKTV